MKNFTNKIKGQSFVETALVLPLILLLLFSFIDLGRGVYYYSAVGNSVREGARFASVNKIENTDDEAAVKAVVDDYSVAVEILADDISISFSGDSDEYVTVSASYEFKPITPFLARLFGSGTTLTLSSETTMLLAPIAR